MTGRSQVISILLRKRSGSNRILSAKNQPPEESLVRRTNIEKRYYETITTSACATGFVNAFAHRERLGWVGASLLAILITGFVEKFYFALRHGLTTIYKSRKQRVLAGLCCKIIQITMILNAGILCVWVVGSALPDFLQIYNKWTIAIHFSLALIGVSAVRDSDAVVISRSGCDFTKVGATE